MPRIWRTPAPTSGSGEGETYKAGEGLAESGAKPVLFLIKALGVKTAMIAEEAVTGIKIATDAVETAKIKNLAVTEGKLATALLTKWLVRAGVKGGQEAFGGTEAADALTLQASTTGGTGRINLNSENVIIEPVLSAKQIAGLEALQVNGVLTTEQLSVTTGISSITGRFSQPSILATELKKSENNWKPGAGSFVRVKASAPFNVTGITKEQNGELVTIINIGTQTISFLNESLSSSETNRFRFSTAANIDLLENQSVTFYYDFTTKRWRDVNQTTITEARLGTGAVVATKIGEGAVIAAKIATNAVEASKIKAEAVEASKAQIATTPTPSATKNTVVLGVSGVARKITAAITTEAAKKAYIVKHGLETSAVTVTLQTEGFEQPEAPIDKVVALNIKEVEITFGGIPADKEKYYATVIG